jgi:hypothetical protein
MAAIGTALAIVIPTRLVATSRTPNVNGRRVHVVT